MSAYSDAVLADSPDVYYRMDETGSGPFVDLVAAHNATPTSTIVSAVSLLASDPDASATFDYNVGPLRATTTYTVSQQPLTVEFWVNPVALLGTGGYGGSVCVACGPLGGWVIQYLDTTGAWRFTTAAVANYDFTAAAVAGVTQHVVFVLQSNNSVDLYINGVFQQNITSASPIGATTAVLNISSHSLAGGYTRSTIDEVAVYKSALSATRIAAHYAAATGTAAPARDTHTAIPFTQGAGGGGLRGGPH